MTAKLRSGGLLALLIIVVALLAACDAVPASPAAVSPGAATAAAIAQSQGGDAGAAASARCPAGGRTHPRIASLASELGVTYAELEAHFCAGHGLGEIRQAYQIADAADEDVDDIFDMRADGMGWGDIKQSFGLIAANRQNDDDDDDDGGRGSTRRCDNPSGAHPQVGRLATAFGVPADEIGEWFCAGYGLGEIKLAYQLAGASGEDVEDIFEMRASGLGWGEIRQQLGLSGQGGPGNGPPIVPRGGPPNQ